MSFSICRGTFGSLVMFSAIGRGSMRTVPNAVAAGDDGLSFGNPTVRRSIDRRQIRVVVARYGHNDQQFFSSVFKYFFADGAGSCSEANMRLIVRAERPELL